MIDVWSLALGIILGLIGIVLHGYFLHGYIKETEDIYKDQIRRRDKWIQFLERENSRLEREVQKDGR